MRFTYRYQIEQDEDGRYVVGFPTLPFGATDGASREEALVEAVDCLETILAALFQDGKLPPPADTSGERIEPSAPYAAQFALNAAFLEAGISKVELAKRLDCSESQVRALLGPYKPSKLSSIEAALACLGKRLRVDILAA